MANPIDLIPDVPHRTLAHPIPHKSMKQLCLHLLPFAFFASKANTLKLEAGQTLDPFRKVRLLELSMFYHCADFVSALFTVTVVVTAVVALCVFCPPAIIALAPSIGIGFVVAIFIGFGIGVVGLSIPSSFVISELIPCGVICCMRIHEIRHALQQAREAELQALVALPIIP